MATIQYDPTRVSLVGDGENRFLRTCETIMTALDQAGLRGLNCTITSFHGAEFKWQGVTLPRLKWFPANQSCSFDVLISHPERGDLILSTNRLEHVISIFSFSARRIAQEREAADRAIREALSGLDKVTSQIAIVEYACRSKVDEEKMHRQIIKGTLDVIGSHWDGSKGILYIAGSETNIKRLQETPVPAPFSPPLSVTLL